MAIKYYVRKSWEDTATQQGAYNVLSNAVAVCDSDTSYRVYDAAGTLMIYNPLYYVRPSWADADKQSGAYRVYSNATADADKRGYRVYDYLGVCRYPAPYTV
ncbi:MAG: hypothetical protein LIO70_01105, partial [Clostridiales bacterium]|nr:hypothetical protein [Clostridiales bacterium]